MRAAERLFAGNAQANGAAPSHILPSPQKKTIDKEDIAFREKKVKILIFTATHEYRPWLSCNTML